MNKILMNNKEYREQYKEYIEDMLCYVEQYESTYLEKHPEKKSEILLFTLMCKVMLKRELNKI